MSSEHGIGGAPAVDERLIMPETRYEIVAGELVHVSPALEPHASRHSKLSALLEAYAADGYNAASDMLTRASEESDLAPDGSIYPELRDPETGGRRLEELAFEVVSTERLANAAGKAAALVGRGVRRVFAIDVERRRALEWSSATETWEILPDGAVIDDRALVLPLPIADLVHAAKADDAVARALIAKNNPVVVAAIHDGEARGKAEGRAEGKAEAMAQAVVAVLRARGLLADVGGVPAAIEQQIVACRDLARLETWLRVAATAATVDELFR